MSHYKPIQTAITAIGIANPKYKLMQKDAAEFMANTLNLTPTEQRMLRAICRTSDIEQRYSVLGDFSKKSEEFEFFSSDKNAPAPSTAIRMEIYQKNAIKLALSAVKNCLSILESFDLNNMTHLITVSCTGMYAPGIDIELVQKLKLKSSVKRTAINFMGCYGAFNALRVADAICRADTKAIALVVCIELCTIHFQKMTSLDSMISNSIFGDGAAAVLIQSAPKQGKSFVLKNFHNDLLAQTSQEMAWQIGNEGFDIVLSSYVPEIIKTGILNFTQNLLNQSGLKQAEIDFYAIHPGGAKILSACETALNISKGQNKYSYQVLKNFGNMSSATVLFVLKAIWDDINCQDDKKNIFSCVFEPGLTLESMILEIRYAYENKN